MNWLLNLWRSFRQQDAVDELKEKLREEAEETLKASDKLRASEQTLGETRNALDAAQRELATAQQANAALAREVEALKALVPVEEQEPPTPQWLDTTSSNEVYKPVFLVVKPDGTTESYSLYNPRAMYPKQDYFEPTIKMRGWRNLKTNEEKFYNVWDYVIKKISYRFDKGEDWRLAMLTDLTGFGDCEDGTIEFVTLCRMCGVPANKVFNACGTIHGMGHSFPVCEHADGELYVYETTLDETPKKPLPLKGSNYKPSWGLANWRLAGFMKEVGNVNENENNEKKSLDLSEREKKKKKKLLEEEWKEREISEGG